ncbi:thymidine kinase [Clostridium botulinum D/C]|uniref:thymidine kinase n=1 Tax=Clostridium botulinum TaxID=1491 RepID=UPI001E410F75|nr:thymidine kinase [Clostridium botulinum]MCD3321675.1 thymidine kinase [Clostridium botulinum D/C]MCD3324955.1 thymidine kinase [Clostridium botulinum D/C]MCD3327733.1 thymidine kinase [Clostridium botulinum D/C]
MAKLYFTYGGMGSGKSLDLLRSSYNYKEKGMDVLIFKPKIDTREGVEKCIIKSRVGAEMNGIWLDKYDDPMLLVHQEIKNGRNISAVFVDEAQFCTTEQIDKLGDIVDTFNIPVLAYGLKTDFQTHLFEGSKRLFELADEIRECRSIDFDGRRATQNARVVDGHIVKQGEQIQIGGNESYVAVTRKNYKLDRLK